MGRKKTGIWKVCEVCGNKFYEHISAPRFTCSKKCGYKRKRLAYPIYRCDFCNKILDRHNKVPWDVRKNCNHFCSRSCHKKHTESKKYEKFIDKIKILNGCWIWIGGISGKGYATFRSKFGIHAHRYSYRYHNGLIPKNMLVLHSCDNPRCVNPKHLELGTQSKNMLDAVKRKRHIGPKFNKNILHY